MKQQMPRIELSRIEGLDAADLALVAGIISGQGANKGCLRASKPNVTMHYVGRDKYNCRVYEPDATEGRIAYIWRMVAFQISPKSEHHCMPVTADFDLPGRCGSDERKAAMAECDRIVEAVVDSVPKTQWNGIIRWGQVFGVVGTPRYNEEGAVIYR
jgi:hypothetical protein